MFPAYCSTPSGVSQQNFAVIFLLLLLLLMLLMLLIHEPRSGRVAGAFERGAAAVAVSAWRVAGRVRFFRRGQVPARRVADALVAGGAGGIR